MRNKKERVLVTETAAEGSLENYRDLRPLFTKWSRKRRLHQFLNDNSTKMSVQKCCVLLPPNMNSNPVVVKTIRNGKEFFRLRNVCLCKSVWACPVCTEYKQAGWKEKIERLTRLLFEQFEELDVHFCTFTVRHHWGDKLAELLDKLTISYRNTTSARVVKQERKKECYLGTARWVEITLGNNGWHPHIHALNFYSSLAGTSPGIFQAEYLRFLNKKNLALPKGQNIQMHLTEKKALQKVSYAFSSTALLKKTAEIMSVRKKSFYLTKAIETLRFKKNRYLSEYLEETKGRHAFQTSRNLFEIVGLDSSDDDDDGEGDSNNKNVVVEIPRPLWVYGNKKKPDGLFTQELMECVNDSSELLSYLLSFDPCDYDIDIIRQSIEKNERGEK